MNPIVAKKKKPASGFGARLYALREAAGLTQEELAKRVGVKRLTLIRYESGETEPGYTIIGKLAQALGVEPNQFWSDGADAE